MYIAKLLYATDQRIEFCGWFQHMVGEDEMLLRKIVRSDEVQFKLNGAVNRHNNVY